MLHTNPDPGTPSAHINAIYLILEDKPTATSQQARRTSSHISSQASSSHPELLIPRPGMPLGTSTTCVTALGLRRNAGKTLATT